jgi:hypothetical protein
LHAKADIIVSLEPDSQSISVGSSVSMYLVVSGLGNFASPSLGRFDFDLSYNPAILSAVSVSFGSHLNERCPENSFVVSKARLSRCLQ